MIEVIIWIILTPIIGVVGGTIGSLIFRVLYYGGILK